MKFEPTYVADHKRHVHVTDNSALLESEAWGDTQKPDIVVYAPDGLMPGERVVVFDGEDPLGELADYVERDGGEE